MSIVGLKPLVINDRLNIILTALNGGEVRFYTTPRPLKSEAVGAATLLAVASLQNPSGTISSGELTFNFVDNILFAITNGEVAWCRFLDSVGGQILDGDCGENASNAFFKFDDVNFVTGGRVKVNSVKIIEAGI